MYKEELSKAKKSFYSRKIECLRKSNPKLWYSNLKRLIKYDPKGDIIEVDSIKDLSDIDQAEEIASKFAEISHLYNPVDRNQIEMATVDEKDVLEITNDEVLRAIKDLKLNKSVRSTDVPPKIFKQYASILSKPITVIINKAIRDGVWPDLLKTEMVTPVPKVSQPKSTDDLRPIAGLMTLNKVFEKVYTINLLIFFPG